MNRELLGTTDGGRVGAALCALVVGCMSVGLASAGDWPQWRGPERDGKSPETGLLAQWPEGGPPLAWEATGLGAGYSSVSIAGGRVFTLGDLEQGLTRVEGHRVAVEHDRGSRWVAHRVRSTCGRGALGS